MNTNLFAIRQSLLAMSTGVVLLATGDKCLSQDAEQKEKELPRVQILLGVEKLDVVSPAIKRQALDRTEQPMLPPGTNSISELHSPEILGIGSRKLEPPSHRVARQPSSEPRYFREQISQQIDFLAQQGNDVQQLKELIERLQLALEDSGQQSIRNVEVAVFAVPEAGQEGPQNNGPPRAGVSFPGPPRSGAPGFGPPDFGPPGMRMGGRAEMHQGSGPKFQHPESRSPEGPPEEYRKRIAALTESAERINQAGLPDIANGLRERAAQLERELAEKQERMQQEHRQRTESALRERQEQARQTRQNQRPQRLMEQRREGFEIELDGHPIPPLRELHEQMEQLRHDLHKLSEQMADLSRLIQKHHNPRNERGHRDEDGDDEDGDDEDGDDEDGDDEDGDDEDSDDEDSDDEDSDDEDGDDEDGDDDDGDDDDGDDDEDSDDEDRKERGEHEQE